MRAPVARYASRSRTAALAAVPLAAFTVWSLAHLLSVIHAFGGHGNELAFAWAFSFALMWWIPVAWFERPYTTTPEQDRQLAHQVVVVQIPSYNEDETALRACLESLFQQTRLPDRIRLVDDGSHDPLTAVRDWYLARCRVLGIDGTWTRQNNQGKRHAQMNVLRHDDSDIIVTLDSDSVLDARALEEGLKPFADPRVTSVAGLVAVLNTRTNWLTMMTAMLYTPFTRSFRSALSVLKCVTVNSGTLAFYRGDVVRQYAGVYENETFRGRPMQMNDDSMLTFYGLLHGHAVHQPTSVVYTLVPENLDNYRRQQMRWMRGTFVRTFWWWRYAPFTSPVFWAPLSEFTQLVMSVVVPVAMVVRAEDRGNLWQLVLATILVGAGVNWMVALRFLLLRRSDESRALHVLLVVLAPISGLWRMFVVKPMHLYALATFWRVGKWGTRAKVEVSLAPTADRYDPITEELPVARVHGPEITAELPPVKE